MDPTQKYNGFLFDPRCSPPTSSGEIVRVVSALCCKQTQKLMVKHNFPGGVNTTCIHSKLVHHMNQLHMTSFTGKNWGQLPGV